MEGNLSARFTPTMTLVRARLLFRRGGLSNAGEFAKKAREEGGERATQSRETGADDAEVGFDHGPFGRVDAVPGDVEVGGGDVEGCDAKNGGDADAWGDG